MKVDKYIEKLDNKTAENRLLKFVVCIIGLSSVISMIMAFAALKFAKTIILPPVVDRRIEISGNDANDDYFKMYGKYTVNLLMNYTPSTFTDQSKDLLALCTPGFYPSLDAKIKEIGDGVQKLSITSVFNPSKIVIDRQQKRLTITGNREQTAKGTLVQQGVKIYIISYEFDNGRFFITDLSEGVPK
jgi:type IV conjugative transfer system protein TraE